MCGCTNKSNTMRTNQSTTRSISDNNRSSNMSKVATFEELEELHNKFPTEFVLANYDNGSNFRYAKSTSGELIKYGFNYYGVFSGIKQIYVHKIDVNETNIKAVKIERNIQPILNEESEINEVLKIEDKPKRKRNKKYTDENI